MSDLQSTNHRGNLTLIKRIIYYENGERKTKDFHVRGARRSDGLHIEKDDEVVSLAFVKTVDYKGSYYVE